jgi:hypothetical protein
MEKKCMVILNMNYRNNRSSYGLFNRFGALDVPAGMRPVSDFRKSENPMLIMPFGPPGQWIVEPTQGAGSSGFGMESLAGRKVTPAGYLSTWYGQPTIAPPSWNPLLHQGENTFLTSPNSPSLSDVVASFGRRRSTKKLSAKKTAAKKSCGFGKKKRIVKKTKKVSVKKTKKVKKTVRR